MDGLILKLVVIIGVKNT